VGAFMKENERIDKVFAAFCGEKNNDDRLQASKALNRQMNFIFNEFCISKWLASEKMIDKLKEQLKKVFQ
jgi:hypothetical protein